MNVAGFLQGRAGVRQGSGPDEDSGQDACLGQVVVGAFVLFRCGNSAVETDGHGQDRQRDGTQAELLLDNEPADRGRQARHVQRRVIT
jgi:hypothetical protein